MLIRKSYKRIAVNNATASVPCLLLFSLEFSGSVRLANFIPWFILDLQWALNVHFAPVIGQWKNWFRYALFPIKLHFLKNLSTMLRGHQLYKDFAGQCIGLWSTSMTGYLRIPAPTSFPRKACLYYVFLRPLFVTLYISSNSFHTSQNSISVSS